MRSSRSISPSGTPVGTVGRIALLLFGLLAPAGAWAQSSGFEFRIPDLTAIPGSTPVVTVMLDSAIGGEVAGFSFGICCDPTIALPINIDPGSDLAQVNSGIGPDFFQSDFVSGGVTVGCVVDLAGTDTLPGANGQSVIDLEYSVTGIVGDQTTLEFCDNLGTPPVTTVVVSQGSSVIPDQVSGALEVVVSTGSTLWIDAPTSVAPGSLTSASVRLDTTDEIEGFRFGVAVVAGQLSIGSIAPGGAVAAANAGAGPDYFAVDLAPPGGTGGTIDCTISLSAPFTSVGPGIGIEIATLNLTVGNSPGPPCSALPISFSASLGAPTIPIDVSTVGGGPDLPMTTDGVVTTSSLSPAPASGGITLSAQDRVISPGSNVTAKVLLDTDLPISALSFGLTYDETDFTLIASSMGTSLADFRCGAGPEFFTSELHTTPTPGVTTASLFAVQPPFTERELLPGSGYEISELEFQTSGAPQTLGTALSFTSSLGIPPVAIEVTVGTTAVLPDVVDGSIVFGTGFTRGNCNADTGVDLADVIFLLASLFSFGASPLCNDACDANDDGNLNIADPIAILSALFGQVTIALPPPADCGADATDDALDCAASPSCR